jgi:hypothetical protein
VTKTPAQLDRDIAEVVASGSPKQPLYGHTSEATAFVVDDYPYGFTLRTKIRYWLEKKAKKGWRFVSQTLNPKTGAWNKPKASTYMEWGGAMFLDEKGHVHWDGVGVYSDDKKILSFVTTFPEADMSELKKVVPAKLRYLEGRISGKIVMTINNVVKPITEPEIEEARKDIATWEEIKSRIAS